MLCYRPVSEELCFQKDLLNKGNFIKVHYWPTLLEPASTTVILKYSNLNVTFFTNENLEGGVSSLKLSFHILYSSACRAKISMKCSLYANLTTVRHLAFKYTVLYREWIILQLLIHKEEHRGGSDKTSQGFTCLVRSHSSDAYLQSLTFRAWRAAAREVTRKHYSSRYHQQAIRHQHFQALHTRGNIWLKSTSQLCKQSPVDGWVTGSHYVLAVEILSALKR